MQRAELLKRNLQLQNARKLAGNRPQLSAQSTDPDSRDSNPSELPAKDSGTISQADPGTQRGLKRNSPDEDEQESIEERRTQLKKAVAQFHIEIKQIENHIKQLAEVYESQRQNIQDKKAQLNVTLEKYAIAQVKLSKLQLRKARLVKGQSSDN